MSASGERLPNLGQQTLSIVTDEGRSAQARYQVADVSRPLTSVGKICDTNKRVIFGKHGVIMCLQTGRTMAFRRGNGVYVINTWTKTDDSSSMRQGK